MRRGIVVFVVVAVVVGLLLGPAPVGAEWDHPVDADVVDPFRPPASRYGAGNRGLEYGTVGGEAVRAVDDGTVVFAGTVGRHRHVVVDHGDGLRSTYAFVQSFSVVRGQSVSKGHKVAVAGAAFHLTARLGGVYVDPMLLIQGAEVVVRLVPGAGPTIDSSAASIGSSLRPDPTAAVFDAAGDLRLSSQFMALSSAAEEWHHQDCTEDGVAVAPPPGVTPASDRVLVQVGGLGTSSDGASIGALDHQSLGYEATDVVGFSYAGGCTPAPFGDSSETVGLDESSGAESSLADELGTSTYGPEDTFQHIDVSAAALADLIESIAAARPGEPIDIAAHSLGGVVTRRAIEMLETRGALDPVGVVVTIGSPHGGADLATAAVATAGSDGADALLDPLIGDAAEFRVADSVMDIAEAGGGNVVDPDPPPDGLMVVAVAGAGDVVVPAEHAMWDGATNVIVPNSLLDVGTVHGALPGTTEVEREFALAVAGAPPRCVGLATVVGSALLGRGISAIEDGVTLLAGLARWVF